MDHEQIRRMFRHLRVWALLCVVFVVLILVWLREYGAAGLLLCLTVGVVLETYRQRRWPS